MKTCKIEGCERKLYCKGYCTMHYQRVKTSGDIGPTNTIASTKEKPLICGVVGCGNTTIYARGFCRKCYSKQYTSPNKCSIEGCDNSLYGNSYCSMHWQRARNNNGDPGPANRIRNYDGYGYLDANGYRIITPYPYDLGIRVLEHRYIMEQHLERKLFPKENIHHINGDRADNRIENLELWSVSQPAGQRVEDKIRWAKEFLLQYGETLPN